MKNFNIKVGNFFFKWRDTLFTIFFIPALFLFSYSEFAFGNFTLEIVFSLFGFLILFLGQIIRAITVGYAYIKRGGLNKQIYAEKLVHRGMFAHVRNPLYLGNILIVTAGILNLGMPIYTFLVLPFFYYIYYCITIAEENFLSGKFGEDYQVYLKEVNRFLPSNLSNWSKSIEGMDFTWKRYFKKEYVTTTVIVFSTYFLVNILKFYYRYEFKLDSFFSQFHIFCICILILVLFIIRILMYFKKLEIEERKED